MVLPVSIYTGEGSTTQLRPSIHAGLEMIASATGIELCVTNIGGCSQLDRREINPDSLPVERLGRGRLHILLGDFSLRGNLAGSYFGDGVVFLNPRLPQTQSALQIATPETTTKIATAHESAHALGFVREELSSTGHCESSGCVMQAKLGSMTTEAERGHDQIWTDVVTIVDTRPKIVPANTSFCGTCAEDMRANIAQQIHLLRAA